MEYRRLGNSGLKVSSVGLGTNNFGGRMDEASSIEVIQSAIDHGINMLDTANIYGANLSEVYIGKAVKGQRDKVLLATKVSGKMGDGPNDSGTSRSHIMYEVEQSLRALLRDESEPSLLILQKRLGLASTELPEAAMQSTQQHDLGSYDGLLGRSTGESS